MAKREDSFQSIKYRLQKIVSDLYDKKEYLRKLFDDSCMNTKSTEALTLHILYAMRLDDARDSFNRMQVINNLLTDVDYKMLQWCKESKEIIDSVNKDKEKYSKEQLIDFLNKIGNLHSVLLTDSNIK